MTCALASAVLLLRISSNMYDSVLRLYQQLRAGHAYDWFVYLRCSACTDDCVCISSCCAEHRAC